MIGDHSLNVLETVSLRMYGAAAMALVIWDVVQVNLDFEACSKDSEGDLLRKLPTDGSLGDGLLAVSGYE